MRRILYVLSASLGVLSLTVVCCVTTPETNRKTINFMPEAQMNAMGKQAYAEVLAKEKVSTDSELNAVIDKVGRRIAKASGKNYDWEFKLIDSKTVNAFCLPGGKVAFYTGILPIAKNEAGVAAIMGHEVAHAVLRHGAERVSQSVLVQLGLAATAVSLKDPQQRNLILAGLGVGLQVGVMLPFSRQHESEADTVGLEYMAKAGYAPEEAVDLWRRMAKEGGGRPPEILSTHPDPLRRSQDLKAEIPKVRKYYEASDKQASAPLKTVAQR